MAVRARGAEPPAGRLLTPSLAAFLALTVATMAGFYLLFSVLPLYASNAGAAAAGLVTGTLMLATVLSEIVTPTLTARLGSRWILGLGAVLLGLPTAALLLEPRALPVILTVAIARGIGLGLTAVTGAVVAAELAPPQRRGEVLAIYGIAGMVPGGLAQPAGLWLVGQWGFAPAFAIAAAAPLTACWLVFFLPRDRRGDAEADRPALLLTAGLVRPALMFLTTTIAVGIYSTFLALALGPAAAGWVVVALLAQNVASAVCRWAAGRVGDRVGNGRLIVPAVVTAALGAALVVAVTVPPVVVAGMLVFGAGFGVLQNATLAVMFEKVPRERFGAVSGMWNATYDGGMGVGAAGFGFLSAATGFPIGLGLTAVLMILSIMPAIVRGGARRRLASR